MVKCCHLVEILHQRRHFRTRLSLFSRNYLIYKRHVLLEIFKLDGIKPAAVDKNDFKMKKQKRESNYSGAVPAEAAWCRSANTLRFQEVKMKQQMKYVFVEIKSVR